MILAAIFSIVIVTTVTVAIGSPVEISTEGPGRPRPYRN
jgi:hypothetical protein